MKDLLILLIHLIVVLLFLVALTIRNIIVSRQESKRFWKAIDDRMKYHDERRKILLNKAFEEVFKK
ncbi:MAG: hypothetical protein AABY22_18810, partial [Nanoarchaeota archaeon]